LTVPPSPSLVVRDVSKRLGGRDVLSTVSLTCAGGQTCTIIGANGSGKSTLLRIVVGLVEPDRGTVEIGGLSAHGSTGTAQRQLGYLPDATDVLPELSVGELVALVQTFKRPRSDEAAAFATLRARLGLDPIWRQRLATLSFGQRKRALLLAALVGGPPLLVLDEPTNGMDGDGSELVASLIDERRRAGLATVLATNDRGLAQSLNARRFELASSRLTPLG
jgi:ABC-type multidrug transport system ATPase subunit